MTNKMKAARFYDIGDIRLENVPIPEIAEDEILIRIKTCAICGTDLRIYKFGFGHYKVADGTARILGHEIAGEIAEVGRRVRGYEKGMRVSVPPNVGCGHCLDCVEGYHQLCPQNVAFGIGYDGGFAEYMRVPANAVERGNVIPIPDELSYEEAAMVEPFSCTFNSYQALQTKPGDTVLIIGAGPIGACHVMISKLAGAANILVADVSDTRLAQIGHFGADHTVNSAREDLLAFLHRHNNNRGADVVITACSVPEVQIQALELARTHGRINFFGGMPKGKEFVTLNTNHIHYKELIVLGTTGSSMQDYHNSIKIAASGRVPLKDLITGRFRIEEIQKAFDYAGAGEGLKSIVSFE